MWIRPKVVERVWWVYKESALRFGARENPARAPKNLIAGHEAAVHQLSEAENVGLVASGDRYDHTGLLSTNKDHDVARIRDFRIYAEGRYVVGLELLQRRAKLMQRFVTLRDARVERDADRRVAVALALQHDVCRSTHVSERAGPLLNLALGESATIILATQLWRCAVRADYMGIWLARHYRVSPRARTIRQIGPTRTNPWPRAC